MRSTSAGDGYTTVGSGTRAAWQDRRMDAAGLTKLLSPEGWALLSALPPYEEGRTMALSEQLRREGVDPELVAAALTQSRLRARAHACLGNGRRVLGELRSAETAFREAESWLAQSTTGNEQVRAEVDDLGGGYLATKHLLDLGHRRIAHFTWDDVPLGPLRSIS